MSRPVEKTKIMACFRQRAPFASIIKQWNKSVTLIYLDCIIFIRRQEEHDIKNWNIYKQLQQ